VPESARRPAPARPLVIQLRGSGIDPAVLRRVGTVVVILTVASVLVAGFLGLAGLAVGVFAVAGVPGDGEPDAGGLGRQISAFGAAGIGAGFFTDARSLGLDADGRIYIGEYQGGRIQVFEATGEFVTQWFADREIPLTGMAVRRDGKVYTVQRGQIVLRDG
jgi:DNA-binding beta-propeller fold protein YncE